MAEVSVLFCLISSSPYLSRLWIEECHNMHHIQWICAQTCGYVLLFCIYIEFVSLSIWRHTPAAVVWYFSSTTYRSWHSLYQWHNAWIRLHQVIISQTTTSSSLRTNDRRAPEILKEVIQSQRACIRGRSRKLWSLAEDNDLLLVLWRQYFAMLSYLAARYHAVLLSTIVRCRRIYYEDDIATDQRAMSCSSIMFMILMIV
jgi:hypothetical protein